MFGVDDDLGVSHTWRGYELVNPNDFDIKPKKDYLKRKLAEREEDKRRIEGARNTMLQYYDSKILEIQTEIERLKKET